MKELQMRVLDNEELELYHQYINGGSKEYEEKIEMKEPYRWDYHIKIRTKEGTFEYEKQDLSNIDLLLTQHPDHTEVRATQNKPKSLVKKLGGSNGKNTTNR